VITYNGEIYNYLELRRQLENKGREFRSGSDTEVLLEAIDELGLEKALNQCIGMFAFALWDRLQRTLYLVRDRMGKKPLFWAKFGRLVLFGSELKALMAHSRCPKQIDRQALSAYFRHNYVPAPLSIFEGIRKLSPGQILRWRAGHEIRIEPYWDLRALARH